MEGFYKIKTGALKDFSEQQMLDCSSGYGNMGCSGGLMTNCYNYLKSYKLQADSTYPYIGYKSTCKYNSANGVVNTLGYVNVVKGDVNAHMNAVALGPVSVAVAASSSVFRLYKTGIISTTTCGTSLNHGVTMIGYGVSNGVAYWLIKNSWGTNWGEAGYVRIAKSTTNGNGICGILAMSSYPRI
jgi:C1A family cysteine protease